MICMFFLFLVGIDKNTFNLSDNICKGVAAFIHFFGLAIFSWTLLEGIQLLKTLKSNQLADTNSSKYSDLVRYLIGYGTPLILTFIPLFLSFVLNNDAIEYMSTEYCWLHEESFIYFFIIPVAVVVVFNSYVFIVALMATRQARKRRTMTNSEKIFGEIKTWAFLSFLLGLTWASGFLIQDGLQGFSYVFVILNGSSGIFLFVHTILMNEIVMLELKIKLGLVDQVELALNRSGDRITASKSFSSNDHKPKARRRRRGWGHQNSTSSDEMPPLPRPPRKQLPRKKIDETYRTKKALEFHNIEENNSYPSTPENTSLSSTNSSNMSSLMMPSSNESLYRKQEQKHERRSRDYRQPQVQHQLQHDRLTELQNERKLKLRRHESVKW